MAAAAFGLTEDTKLTVNGPLGLFDPFLRLAFRRIADRAATAAPFNARCSPVAAGTYRRIPLYENGARLRFLGHGDDNT